MTDTMSWKRHGRTIELAAVRRGRGPKILMLPAMSSISTRAEMAPLAERLADRFETIAVDWPGFGQGSRPALPLEPDDMRAFVDDVLARLVPRPIATIAAGHGAGYLLDAAARTPGSAGALVLLAPTWRGPLPTMMGRRSSLADAIVRLGDTPILGHALYHLNVNPVMVRLMTREHVYSDRNWLRGERLAQKAAVARGRGARHASLRFVSGHLDPAPDRESMLRVATRVKDPVLLVYGAGTPRKSKAEMAALAALPNVASAVLPEGKLGVHEEFPAEVAAAITPFLASLTRGVSA